MRLEINADILFPMPGITAGMGFQRDYIGISKISALSSTIRILLSYRLVMCIVLLCETPRLLYYYKSFLACFQQKTEKLRKL